MSSQSRPDGRPTQVIPELDAALRDVVEDFARHSRKNSEAIDVLVHALKAVHQDLQEEKVRSQVLEARLKKAEAGSLGLDAGRGRAGAAGLGSVDGRPRRSPERALAAQAVGRVQHPAPAFDAEEGLGILAGGDARLDGGLVRMGAPRGPAAARGASPRAASGAPLHGRASYQSSPSES